MRRGEIRRAALAGLVGLATTLGAGCSSPTVDIAPLPSDYTSWCRVDATGPVPGHGDSYRIIYVNDMGRQFDPTDEFFGLRSEYQVGTIIVKEVHQKSGDQPGPLEVVDIMRMLGDSKAPSGTELGHLVDNGSGWLFTSAPDGQSAETYHASCWQSCHSSAPINGAFLDYTTVPASTCP